MLLYAVNLKKKISSQEIVVLDTLEQGEINTWSIVLRPSLEQINENILTKYFNGHLA